MPWPSRAEAGVTARRPISAQGRRNHFGQNRGNVRKVTKRSVDRQHDAKRASSRLLAKSVHIMKLPLILTALAWVSPTALAGPAGEWRIADGTATVTLHACGIDLCGYVSWTKEGDPIVGKPVVISMKKTGNVWSGTIVNARDGQKYVARMSLHNEDTLKVEGCIIGGLICGGQHWSRLK
jgi:uncharacterized protein (DUF2147 family)